jgi:hypothetical protein
MYAVSVSAGPTALADGLGTGTGTRVDESVSLTRELVIMGGWAKCPRRDRRKNWSRPGVF